MSGGSGGTHPDSGESSKEREIFGDAMTTGASQYGEGHGPRDEPVKSLVDEVSCLLRSYIDELRSLDGSKHIIDQGEF